MVDKYCDSLKSKDESLERRLLKTSGYSYEDERSAFKSLLFDYFNDNAEDIECLARSIKVVPKDFYGKIFFTDADYRMVKNWSIGSDTRSDLIAEYLSFMLGLDFDATKEYIVAMDKRKELLLENFNIDKPREMDEQERKLVFKNCTLTQKDIEELKRSKAYWEDKEDQGNCYSRGINYDEEIDEIDKMLKDAVVRCVDSKSALGEYAKNIMGMTDNNGKQDDEKYDYTQPSFFDLGVIEDTKTK